MKVYELIELLQKCSKYDEVHFTGHNGAEYEVNHVHDSEIGEDIFLSEFIIYDSNYVHIKKEENKVSKKNLINKSNLKLDLSMENALENPTLNISSNKSFTAKLSDIIEASKDLLPEEEKEYGEALNTKVLKENSDNMFNQTIKIKINLYEDRDKLVNILVNAGYKVWIERREIKSIRMMQNYYVCFDYKCEEE